MSEQTLALPFSFDSGGVVAAKDSSKIWQDRVYTALTTSFLERLMNPVYGTAIMSAIFETLDVATDIITKTVNSAFSTWLHDLNLRGIIVEEVIEQDLGTASLNITINYSLPDARTDGLTIKTATFTRSGTKLQEIM